MIKNKNRIYTIGVTGGIGGGKSTVCAVFAKYGVPVVGADDVSKELSSSDPSIKKKLAALLGDKAFDENGALDRTFIASRIFSDKNLRRKIEAVLHPAVKQTVERRCFDLEKLGHRMVVIEAALMYESGMEKQVDAVITVEAEESVRIRRVQERDGTSPDSIKERINAQFAEKQRTGKADYVIQNNGELEELELKVRFLYSLFEHLLKEV